MGPVMKAASMKPEVALLDNEDMQGIEGDIDWQFVSLGEQQNFGIKTSGNFNNFRNWIWKLKMLPMSLCSALTYPVLSFTPLDYLIGFTNVYYHRTQLLSLCLF
jgi:hypothetical protein